MAIWHYEDFDFEGPWASTWHDGSDICRFCETRMKLIWGGEPEVDPGGTVLAEVHICEVCGWWKAFRSWAKDLLAPTDDDDQRIVSARIKEGAAGKSRIRRL
jgi:hypothetical protein